MTLGTRPRLDSRNFGAQGAFRDFRVMGRLGAQPVAVGKAEKPAQAQVGVGGNGTFTRYDVTDALRRHADLLRQSVLADPHRPQEFFQQDLAGRYGLEFTHHHPPSVIVHDLDIFSASVCPTEAHAELIVYPDALLPGAITFQGFESIAGRHPQIVQSARDLQLPQLASRHVRDVREPTDPLASRKSLCVGALERLDHGPIVT
jgi:hypothetical protein